MSKFDVEPVTDIKAELGEGPLWSVAEQSIYWIDVTQRKIFRHNLPTGKTETFKVPGMPGCIGFHKPGSVIVSSGIMLSDENVPLFS